MYRIKTILILSIILISTINVLSAENNIKNQDNGKYEVLKSVSKRFTYKLNREILFDKGVVEKMSLYTTYYSFCNSLYKGLWQVDIKQIITKNDIIELQQNINIATSSKKWNRKLLKRFRIPTTLNEVSNQKSKNLYQKSKSLYQTSPPIFFKNNEFAIIYIRIYCGPECGEKAIEIYRKNSSGSWEYFGEILIGIS